MPESTPDIQDIAQLVEQADTLLSELEAVASATAQATSDEGAIIEPREWEPPVDPPEPKQETEVTAAGEAADPVASEAETNTASEDDSSVEPEAQDTTQRAEPVAESDSDADTEPDVEKESASADEPGAASGETADENAAVGEARASCEEAAASTLSDVASEEQRVSPGAVAEPSPEPTAGDVATSKTQLPSSSEAQPQTETKPSDETVVTCDQDTEPNLGEQAAEVSAVASAGDVDPAPSVDPADVLEAGEVSASASDRADAVDEPEPVELNAGDAVRIEDPPVDTDESLEEKEEPVCEVESEDSHPEPAGEILMDEECSAAGHVDPNADGGGRAVDESDETSERVRSLDDELARLADEMIEGENEDASVLIDPVSEDDAASDESDAEHETSGAAASDTKAAEKPEAASVAAKSDCAASASGPPADTKGRVLFHARAAAQQSVGAVREKGPLVAAHLAPAAKQTCELVSKPLQKKSPIVRRAVGVVAVTTALYASAVLFYVAFIRTPSTPQPEQPGTTLIDETGQAIASHPGDD
jgi:nicotinate-nucleotide--dimethylbenzimidazole phosphoribosyltransferase